MTNLETVVLKRGRSKVRVGPGIVLTMLFLALLLVCAVAPGLIAPYGANDQDLRAALQPPVWSGGTWDHPLGTDTLGRDLLSRLVYGTRVSLGISLCTAVLTGVIGVGLGLVSGFMKGWIERAIMVWTDAQQAIGGILITMVMVLTFGNSALVIILSLSSVFWMFFARVVRTQVQTLRESAFVDSSVVIGASTSRIIIRHVLPHLSPAILSLALLMVSRILLVESGLSFLGVGIQPPSVSWGLVLGSGRDFLAVAYWVATFAGVLISLTVVAFTVFARWLVPLLDKSAS